MSTLYTQDSTPTNPFGIGFYEQAVATSQRLIREREAVEAQLLPQINDGPFAFSAVRAARTVVRALEADPTASPAALAAARAKFEELDSGRARLTAQQEQNARLLEQTRDGLVTNQARLNEARAKAANQPADRPIVNAGADPAANSAPPVVSPSNITGTQPPLDVTTPAASSPAPVPPSLAGDNGGFVTNAQGEQIPSDSAEAEEIRAEQNRVEAENAAPLREFVIDPVTGEQVPSDSVQADEIRADQDALAIQNAAAEPVAGTTDAGLLDPQQQAEQAALTAAPEPVPGGTDPGLADPAQRAEQAAQQAPLTPEQQAAKEQAAAKENAINQATRQSVYKQGGSTDWRVRLQLSPTSNYLYNAKQPGILGPLFATNGVLFPYTPQIQTNYEAKYTDYDLVHSNFRGVFYQNSRVGDISIRAEFTAQDTNEANYLLAVIHFFRSVTKMFYGKDPQRGTPPPLVYLSGLGMNQFYGHPCLVRQFQYSLPNNVDYIRASTNNNYGTDLLERLRPASSPSSAAGLGATGNRILNAGLEKFFPSNKPAPNPGVGYSLNNTQLSNYVPTKMEIDIVLIPVQTRSQVSKQFSLENFANGNLIKNGFW
jgi:hypothetical protein